MKKRLFSLLCSLFFVCLGFSQKQNYRVVTVAFYNVENLFDTVPSVDYIDGTKRPGDPFFHRSIPAQSALAKRTPFLKKAYSFKNLKGKKALRRVMDLDFTPSGKYRYTAARYAQKIDHLSQTLAAIGRDLTHMAPVLIGLAEVENENVLNDLIHAKALAPYRYEKIHFNSFDPRGIDVALLYQKSRFVPTFTKPYTLYLFDEKKRRKYTRDILLVRGELDGETLYLIVNHWPSRYGGEARSRPFRMSAAVLIRKRIVPDIELLDPDPKIIIMGDFNDDPSDRSLTQGLGAIGKKRLARRSDQLHNPMAVMHRRGLGTLAWRDSWYLFDQMITSPELLGRDYSSYRFYKAAIFDKKYLRTPAGAFKGYPYRTYVRGRYQGGYSDHLPVYLYLIERAQQT